MSPTLIPVLLGLDLNAYSMAIAFYEAFGVKSHAFGRYACGITEHSRLVKPHIIPALTERETAARALLSFAREHRGAYLLLVPCADRYVELLRDLRARLSPFFHTYFADDTALDAVSDKASFYALCERYAVPYPRTLCIGSPEQLPRLETADIPYPAVLKPSDTNEYYRHPFTGMQKVYFPKGSAEARAIGMRIYAAGYRGTLLLQQCIGDGAPVAKTLTVAIDRHGHTSLMTLARAVLEERTPTAVGNYAALLTEPTDALSERLCRLLEAIGYRGIANFDLLYDRYGQGYALECNPRQGRSCDHVRAAGINLAAFLYAQCSGGVSAVRKRYPTVFWRCVSDRCVRHLGARAEDVRLCMQLRAHGFAFSPFAYEDDLRLNPMRRLYVALHALRRSHALHVAARTASL